MTTAVARTEPLSAVRRAADEGTGLGGVVGDVLGAVRPAAAAAGFPLLLLIAGAAFLLLQHRIDRRDPKLARSPLTADSGLPFRPPPEA